MKYLTIFLLIALTSAVSGKKSKKSKKGGGKDKNGEGQGGPVNSCDKQSECLNTIITPEDGQYKICVWWNSHLNNCRKDSMDSISHVCFGEQEENKIEGCNSGESNKICRTVDCDQRASFGLKDGSDCLPNENGEYISAYGFSNVEGIICKAGSQGGMCAGGAKKDCVWMIPAPECEVTAKKITTASPGDTTITPKDDDTVACIRQPDDQDICARQGSDDECTGVFESNTVDGCIWDTINVQCTRACGYYPVKDCEETCGCAAAGEECIPSDIMDSASSARMRIDEYVVEDEYEVIDEESGNAQWIKGVDNMWLYIGAGAVVGLLLILIIGVVGYKVMNKEKYVEMEENVVHIEEVQMNEIEAQEFHTIDTL